MCSPVGPATSPPRRPPIPPRLENCAPLERRELANAKKVGACMYTNVAPAVHEPSKYTKEDNASLETHLEHQDENVEQLYEPVLFISEHP